MPKPFIVSSIYSAFLISPNIFSFCLSNKYAILPKFSTLLVAVFSKKMLQTPSLK